MLGCGTGLLGCDSGLDVYVMGCHVPPSTISLSIWHQLWAGAGGKSEQRVHLEAASQPRPQLISWITQEWHLQPACSRTLLLSSLNGNFTQMQEKPLHSCSTERRDLVGWGNPSQAHRGSPQWHLQSLSSGGCLPVKTVSPGMLHKSLLRSTL